MNSKFPLVSIIIPTKNEERNIGRCLGAIFGQTYPKKQLEVIIVDNFSKDRTTEIAKKFPVSFFQKGPERNVQRDYGVAKSQGKYLMFIDADMELEKNLIREAVEKCEKKNYDALVLPEHGAGKGFWAKCQALEKEACLGDELLEAPNRFIKKTVYEKVGGYDKDLIVGEDFDLGDRIFKAGFKVGRTESFINHYEKASLWHLLKKKYYYGKEMPKYFRKSGTIGIRRFNLFRFAFFRNWKLFVRDPVHGAGLIFMKTTQWLAGGFGFLVSLVKPPGIKK